MQRPCHPYASESYANALRHIGRAVALPEWDGFVLARAITAGIEDACGPYPLTVIPRTADIRGGFDTLATLGMVSLVIVPDPLASPDVGQLANAFDVCRPFKKHAIIDLAHAPYDPTKHHRDRIRRAGRRCKVSITRLSDHIIQWNNLYNELKERRNISNQSDFDDDYFDMICGDERFVCFIATIDSDIGGMTIWFEHDGIAYSHLTASNENGYKNGAIYALNDAAISHFGNSSVINLGGGAGIGGDPTDGLFEFKRGFANKVVDAYVCGSALDAKRYNQLSQGINTDFFPAYRSGGS